MISSMPLKKLKRYTHLPQLLHLLSTSSITVLSPSAWDDQNDAHFLERYKEARSSVKTLLVLCMTDAADTYHHWNVFASGPSGVKLEFNPELFESWATDLPNARLERVKYLKLEEFDAATRDKMRLPFLKRIAFRDEGEIRLVIEDTETVRIARSFSFNLSIIEKISLSPWLPLPLVDSVVRALKAVYRGTEEQWNATTVRRTSLLANDIVMEAGSREA